MNVKMLRNNGCAIISIIMALLQGILRKNICQRRTIDSYALGLLTIRFIKESDGAVQNCGSAAAPRRHKLLLWMTQKCIKLWLNHCGFMMLLLSLCGEEVQVHKRSIIHARKPLKNRNTCTPSADPQLSLTKEHSFALFHRLQEHIKRPISAFLSCRGTRDCCRCRLIQMLSHQHGRNGVIYAAYTVPKYCVDQQCKNWFIQWANSIQGDWLRAGSDIIKQPMTRKTHFYLT